MHLKKHLHKQLAFNSQSYLEQEGISIYRAKHSRQIWLTTALKCRQNLSYAMTSVLLIWNTGFNFKHFSMVRFDSLRMQMQIHILMSKSWTVRRLQL